jgi:hypothetical protein
MFEISSRAKSAKDAKTKFDKKMAWAGLCELSVLGAINFLKLDL